MGWERMEKMEKRWLELRREYKERLEGVIGELSSLSNCLERDFKELWEKNPEELQRELQRLANYYQKVARSVELWWETEPDLAMEILKEIEF